MTLLELQNQVWAMLGADSDFISATNVTLHLNWAQVEFALKTGQPRGNFALEPIAGQTRYTLPSELLELRSARYLGRSLSVMTVQQMRLRADPMGASIPSIFGMGMVSIVDTNSTSISWETQVGIPEAIVVENSLSREIRVYPIPDMQSERVFAEGFGIPSGSIQMTQDFLNYLPSGVNGQPVFNYQGQTTGGFGGAIDVGAVTQSGTLNSQNWANVVFTGTVGIPHQIQVTAPVLLEGTRLPQTLTNNADVPEIAPHFHAALVHGALYKIYLQDGEMQNEAKAASHRSLFTQETASFNHQSSGVRLGLHQQPTMTVSHW